MPLSEEEQRILSEIEQQLYATDPELAREIADSTLYRHAARSLKWAAVGFLAGSAILVGTLHLSPWLALVGFFVMLACTLSFERNIRQLGRAGLESLSGGRRAVGLRDTLGDSADRLRDRFRRDG